MASGLLPWLRHGSARRAGGRPGCGADSGGIGRATAVGRRRCCRGGEPGGGNADGDSRQLRWHGREYGGNLLLLPERCAQFAAYVNDFIESQKVFNEEQRAFNARVDDFIENQKETNARQEETNARVERRLQQITDDLGDLKGHVAGRIAREMDDDIAERRGFELVEVLNGQDLRRMLRQHNPSDIDPGTRRSFYQAEAVGRVLDQDGNELYLAAEASCTADRRDANRAVRNAEFRDPIHGSERGGGGGQPAERPCGAGVGGKRRGALV